MREFFQANDLMAVIVTDTSNKPIAGATVTFTITQGSGALLLQSAQALTLGTCASTGSTATCTTDATGQAGVGFLASSASGQSFIANTVTATYNGLNVNFIETVYLGTTNQGGFSPDPTVQETVPAPGAGRVITAQVGQTLKGAIQVSVTATGGPSSGTPIPNVALVASTGLTPSQGPTATCASAGTGNAVLTDATGLATCDLVVGGQVGNAVLSVTVGSANNQLPLTLMVTPGAPGTITAVSGDKQAGNVNQKLPLPLVAKVTDASGNVLTGVTVNYTVTPAGAVTFASPSGTTDSSGMVSNTVTLGSNPGTATIKLTAGTATGQFTATINANFGAVTAVSGNNQTTVISTPFPQPLVVKLTDTSGKPVSGATITFSISGAGTLSATSATTDTSGTASVKVTAGASAGNSTVTATVGNFTTTFTLTSILPGPVLSLSSFQNGASFAPGIAIGGIVVITAPGIAPTVQGIVNPPALFGQLPTTLAGVDVNIAGIQAPIYYVANINGQQSVAIQAPFELSPGLATVTIHVNGGVGTLAGVPVFAVQPGIFETVDSTGRKYAVVTRSDGSYISPSNPAHLGETIRAYMTGLGQTTPAVGTNHAGIPGQNVIAPIIAGVNNSGATFIGAATLPGAIGVYTIDLQIPAGTPTGNAINLSFAATAPDGTKIYSNTSSIAITN